MDELIQKLEEAEALVLVEFAKGENRAGFDSLHECKVQIWRALEAAETARSEVNGR